MSEQTLCTSESSNCEVHSVPQNGNGFQERSAVFCPRVDLVDCPDAIILWADLPGVDENSIDVTLEKSTLTLKAKVPVLQFEGLKPLFREYAVGDYMRTFAISEEISREGIEATVTQGVLKLVLPKTKHAAMRKVTVKAG